ncbi:phosphatase PAP2 family protein [uncultured Ferrovibrio sp.]|jgi:PAP2 superfamily.|uniref:phosphatase PAP2 family protein n=1 Tax=uncultured Ferrovibrio sp. TaxID=1576913 RepID=UPI0026049286|nr:phosphatase PAP2 family protein [uncultured Ferrovibrio sp.]
MMMAPAPSTLKFRILQLSARRDRWMLPLVIAFFVCPLAAFLIDPWLALFIHGKRDSWVVSVAQWVTDFGNAWRYLLGLAVLLAGSYIFKNASNFRARCIYVFVSICASGAITEVLAFIIGRSRPRLLIEQGIYQLSLFNGFKPYDSLPSSHAASVLAFVFAAALVFPNARGVLFIYGFLLAITRVLINAHYFGDLVASAAVSGAAALFLLRYLPQKNTALTPDTVVNGPT